MSLLDSAGVVATDIWCTGAFSFRSPLKDLLDTGSYTLEQLLAEDELLQELRGVHPQLIEYFSTPEAVTDLIRYVIMPPTGTPPRSIEEALDLPVPGQAKPPAENGQENAEEEDEEMAENDDDHETPEAMTEEEKREMLYIRFPYMACEVICCEISAVVDTIVDGLVPIDDDDDDDVDADQLLQSVVSSDKDDNVETEVAPTDDEPQSILDLLFSMLYDSKPGEIDDYRAGYFDKLLSVLFRRRPQAMSRYLNSGAGRGDDALMKAMFKHLYSHSIMQIVQRLLLPQPPSPEPDEEEENKEGEDLYADTLDQPMETDGSRIFRCDWSESSVALDLLLHCLISSTGAPPANIDDERLLSLCQNSSEVLITIIQNSPLTSPMLHTLTTEPVLEKLMVAGSCPTDGSTFSPHDSSLTCTMNVLESLILQLGGYGSVGTVILPEEDGDREGIEVNDGDPLTITQTMRQNLATPETLRKHLPKMLDSLSQLLLHPSAQSWLSPMQFSKDEPQQLLGSSRLRIVRLLESLVLLGDPGVDSILCQSKCLEICLDLFWKFQWCSMLHQSVANLLVHVFEGANARSELQEYFIEQCNLLGRLMDSFIGTENDMGSSSPVASNFADAFFDIKRRESPLASSVETGRGSLENGELDDVLVGNDNEDPANQANENPAAEEVVNPTVSPSHNPESLNVSKASLMDQHEDIASLAIDMAPEQSFRLGYMGHVIIICQALVHACTCEGGGQDENPQMMMDETSAPNSESRFGEMQPVMNGDDDAVEITQGPGAEDATSNASHQPEPFKFEQAPYENGELEMGDADANSLILAQLVDTHTLAIQWQDFVTTTLATETTIQSTPLGGMHLLDAPMDPLLSHRPGLADDGDYDDDGAAPPLPPRGLLVDGDVIDMDDNDLEMAANMIEGLTLNGGPGTDADTRNADLLAGIAPQEEATDTGNYVFDDPLGDGRFGRFNDSDDSSSDEESEISGSSKNSYDSDNANSESETPAPNGDDAPVMNLFAGNVQTGDEPGPDNTKGGDQPGWANFANFDDAFVANPSEGGTPPGDDAFAVLSSDAVMQPPSKDADLVQDEPIDESSEPAASSSAESAPSQTFVEVTAGETETTEMDGGDRSD